MERSYTILIAVVAAWAASLTLVLIPTLGLTTPVYPPPPEYTYELIFLIASTCVAATYSMYLGIKQLFLDGIKLRAK